MHLSDPYDNVLTVHAAGQSDRKHLVLWPPDARAMLQTGRPLQRNLATAEIEIASDGSSRAEPSIADATRPLACSLRQGDSLFVPRGWWHAVRNGDVADHAHVRSWSAAVGVWFLPRTDAASASKFAQP